MAEPNACDLDRFGYDWFHVPKGMRQGCPIRCLMFVIAVEYLRARINNIIDTSALSGA